MKKIFIYIFISLFFFNTSFAKVLNFRCIEKFASYRDGIEKYNGDTLLLLQIDTKKKLIREWTDFASVFSPEWKITKITEYNYFSNKPVNFSENEIDFTTRASFNRYTGSYTSRTDKDYALYIYNCKPTSQLY